VDDDIPHQVLHAAEARAAALVTRDADGLRELLHPRFHWTSHTGERFNRKQYVEANTGGSTAWHSQTLRMPGVAVVGNAAVLRCVAVDVVAAGDSLRVFRMPMTQTWVRGADRWLCLAGHAGPLLADTNLPV
jgi:hypothetical protein